MLAALVFLGFGRLFRFVPRCGGLGGRICDECLLFRHDAEFLSKICGAGRRRELVWLRWGGVYGFP